MIFNLLYYNKGNNMTETTTTWMERYLREKVLSYEPPYYLSFYSVEHVSKDFLREWKDLDWC